MVIICQSSSVSGKEGVVSVGESHGKVVIEVGAGVYCFEAGVVQ